MKHYIDAPLVRRMIANGQVKALPANISALAFDFLDAHVALNRDDTTWYVDWAKTPHVSIDWASATDAETAKWLEATVVGSCPKWLVLYNTREPCLLGEPSFLVMHLDEVLWMAPGNRVVLGVQIKERGDIEFDAGVLEFNGRGELRANV